MAQQVVLMPRASAAAGSFDMLAGADVLGISLSTQRMSVVVQEDGPWLERLCENFPMDL